VNCKLCLEELNAMSKIISSVTIICLIAAFTAFAQTSKKLRFFCGYGEGNHGEELCEHIQRHSFTSNELAEKAVDRILRPLGLKPNFVLVSCPNIDNASAVTFDADGVRYIFYDNAFMEGINRGANTDWASMSILAHEVGHHLSGHTTLKLHIPPTRDDLRQRREQELEADEFSGHALFQMGASLAQAQAAMRVLDDVPDPEEDYNHPKQWRRLEAIKTGYNNAKSQRPLGHIDKRKSAEQYFSDGLLYFLTAVADHKREKFYDAVENYTAAITINPNYTDAYYWRGVAKSFLGDRPGACKDYHKSCAMGDEDACSRQSKYCNDK